MKIIGSNPILTTNYLLKTIKRLIMYKEGIKYKLTGYQPVGIAYNVPRTEIAEYKNGYWYPYGCGKKIVNFIIQQVIEL